MKCEKCGHDSKKPYPINARVSEKTLEQLDKIQKFYKTSRTTAIIRAIDIAAEALSDKD
jgi:DNA replicative helicase MCM subunit Mcm2 (Cdc46/Mcm family)